MTIMRVRRLCTAGMLLLLVCSVAEAQRTEARGAAQNAVGSVRTESVMTHSVKLQEFYRIETRGAGRGPTPDMSYFGKQIGLQGTRSVWLEICERQYVAQALATDACVNGLRAPRKVVLLTNFEDLHEKLPTEPPPGRVYVLIWREDRKGASGVPCVERAALPPSSTTRICGWSSAFELTR